MRFASNPELIRHLRAELRPVRAAGTIGGTLVVSVLIVVLGRALSRDADRSDDGVYAALLGAQYAVIALWCASACGQAICRERELKTFDFWRTTRLTSRELVLGMILGRPITGYVAVASTIPITAALGLRAGYPASALLGAYALMAVFAVFVSLFGLWASMLSDRSSSGLATALISLVPIVLGAAFIASPLPGLPAIGLFPAILWLHGTPVTPIGGAPRLFGMPISLATAAVILYVSLSGWLALMLIGNVKREFSEIRLLSARQALAFAAFLNLLFYAFLDIERAGASASAAAVLALNGMVLYLMGLAMLAPPERLKAWWRDYTAGRRPYVADDGLSWPWLGAAAVMSGTLLAAYAAARSGTRAIAEWRLDAAAVALLVVLVFAARDVLFLQWCKLTRMRHPIVKGAGVLTLYYLATSHIVIPGSGSGTAALLAPWAAFGPPLEPISPPVVGGIVLHAGVIGCLLVALHRRLGRREK